MRQLIFLMACVPLFAQGKWDSLIIRYTYTIVKQDSLIWPAYTYYNQGYGAFCIERSKVGYDLDNPEKGDENAKFPKGPDAYFYFTLKEVKPTIFHKEAFFGRGYPIMDDEIQVWNLTKETKQILGFNCQKAYTIFRLRQYEVWFTPEIPVPIGPWKLRGLGGAILEARSSEGTYSYVATEINNQPEPKKFFHKKKNKAVGLQEILEEFIEQRDKFISWQEYVYRINKDYLDEIKYRMSSNKSDEYFAFFFPPETQEMEFITSKNELLKLYPEFKEVIEQFGYDN